MFSMSGQCCVTSEDLPIIENWKRNRAQTETLFAYDLKIPELKHASYRTGKLVSILNVLALLGLFLSVCKEKDYE